MIAKDGKLVLEEYFSDAQIDKPHYQMSITKSILSHGIGKAIEQGKIGSENDLLLDYLPVIFADTYCSDSTNTISLKGRIQWRFWYSTRAAKIEFPIINLKDDVSESTNLADQYPEIVEKLEQLILQERDKPELEQFRFGNYRTD